MGGELYKAIVGRPHNIPELVVIKMEELKQKNNCPPYHSYINHRYWMSRHRVCPYCIFKSRPVPDLQVDELNGNGENVVVKNVEFVII